MLHVPGDSADWQGFPADCPANSCLFGLFYWNSPLSAENANARNSLGIPSVPEHLVGIISCFCETFGEQANAAAGSFPGIAPQTLPFEGKSPVTFGKIDTRKEGAEGSPAFIYAGHGRAGKGTHHPDHRG
jgi:hypothetical protein